MSNHPNRHPPLISDNETLITIYGLLPNGDSGAVQRGHLVVENIGGSHWDPYGDPISIVRSAHPIMGWTWLDSDPAYRLGMGAWDMIVPRGVIDGLRRRGLTQAVIGD